MSAIASWEEPLHYLCEEERKIIALAVVIASISSTSSFHPLLLAEVIAL
jgi:hypothetical protein